MRMSRSLLLSGVVVLGLAVAGCNRKATQRGASEHAGEPKSGEHRDETISFKKGKGLHVPAKTAQIIGLKIEDVREQQVKSMIRFDAQVYRTTAEGRLASLTPTLPTTALASGQVNRTDAARLKAGREVVVKRKSGSDLQASIKELHHTFGKAVNKAEVVLAVADEKGELEQGEIVTARRENETGKVAATVPKSALLRTAEGNFVYTVSGERYVRTPITVGAVDGEFAEVTEGLYAGDQVVVHPVMTLWMAELQSIRGGQSCTDGH